MFTGIVNHCGEIKSIEQVPNGIVLVIESSFKDLQLGESISVDGVCLTVDTITTSQFTAKLSPETLGKSVAGEYTIGTKVNLERALAMGDRLGGHWVTGHVETVGRLKRVENQGEFILWEVVGFSPEERTYLTEKGSVALNGVSLTINSLTDEGIELMLVPHTLEITSLGSKVATSRLNVEFDCMAKLVIGETRRYLMAKETL